MNDDLLRARFHSLTVSPPAGPQDREQIVVTRARGMQRRRRALASVAGVALLFGGVGLWQSVDPHDTKRAVVTPASGHLLVLRLDLPSRVTLARPASLVARLTGQGTAETRYGWSVQWGDGSLDRAYGSSCPSDQPAPLDDNRSYSHRYARPGAYHVRVIVTRCGQQQVKRTATVVVTAR